MLAVFALVEASSAAEAVPEEVKKEVLRGCRSAIVAPQVAEYVRRATAARGKAPSQTEIDLVIAPTLTEALQPAFVACDCVYESMVATYPPGWHSESPTKIIGESGFKQIFMTCFSNTISDKRITEQIRKNAVSAKLRLESPSEKE
ncbi:hypothetical protein [Chitinolyticbacter albus]|uniref:hypothetical protein n=1 Tax=Chitinolyticbacter albus TaxID=2961951 RepID=UPI002108ACF0|nr:hypothetical protein [Chitinolyticbacter albus]